ncbi:MAG: plasmid replication protein RepC [Hyphomicrobiales bacterium]|nr:plasmid replication protein RepC [Hyphomicrobiales bacterium]
MSRRRHAGKPGSNIPAAVNKWQLFRTLTEIRERLDVSDRSLSVLNALLSFHPETALSLPKARTATTGADDGTGQGPSGSCDLVVFPSNRQLSQRAHGMAPKTLWRHLTALVESGLIIRRDSPNGKRYARKDACGQERFSDAFGFDLSPLVARAAEFEGLAEELRAAQKRRALIKERISLMRRDVSKTVALGLDEGLPGDWEGYRQRAMALMTPLRRIRDDRDLETLATALAALRAEAAKALESQVNVQDMSSNASQSGRHQSNSYTQPHPVLEPASKEEGGDGEASMGSVNAATDGVETGGYPLGMVIEACPDVRDYAPGGKIKTWGDFLAAAGAVRPMIGISPHAWREAQAALGQVEAHVVVATILQRSIHSSEAETVPGPVAGSPAVVVNGSPAIQSAGGYLRALTEKARAGEFALGPVLMALIGQRLKAKRARAAGTL